MIDPSIPLGIRPMPPFQPLESLGQVLQMQQSTTQQQEAEQRRQMNQLSIQKAQMGLTSEQEARQEEEDLKREMQNAMGPTGPDMNRVVQVLYAAGKVGPAEKAQQMLSQQQVAQIKSHDELVKSTAEQFKLGSQMVGNVLETYDPNEADPAKQQVQQARAESQWAIARPALMAVFKGGVLSPEQLDAAIPARFDYNHVLALHRQGQTAADNLALQKFASEKALEASTAGKNTAETMKIWQDSLDSGLASVAKAGPQAWENIKQAFVKVGGPQALADAAGDASPENVARITTKAQGVMTAYQVAEIGQRKSEDDALNKYRNSELGLREKEAGDRAAAAQRAVDQAAREAGKDRASIDKWYQDELMKVRRDYAAGKGGQTDQAAAGPPQLMSLFGAPVAISEEEKNTREAMLKRSYDLQLTRLGNFDKGETPAAAPQAPVLGGRPQAPTFGPGAGGMGLQAPAPPQSFFSRPPAAGPVRPAGPIGPPGQTAPGTPPAPPMAQGAPPAQMAPRPMAQPPLPPPSAGPAALPPQGPPPTGTMSPIPPPMSEAAPPQATVTFTPAMRAAAKKALISKKQSPFYGKTTVPDAAITAFLSRPQNRAELGFE